MLDSEVKKKIGQMYFLENRPIREISRQLDLHRNTVRKYVSQLQGDDIQKDGQKGISQEGCLTEIADKVFEQEKYVKGNRLTGSVISFIGQKWAKSKKKNRMALYIELRNRKHTFSVDGIEGYEIERLSISYSTFYKAVKIAEQRSRLQDELQKTEDGN